jgi:translation initiation factor IF-2
MRAGTMLEKAKELAVLLAFDVPIDKDAEKLAEESGVKIFKGKKLCYASRAYYTSILVLIKVFLMPCSRYYLSFV